MAASKTQPVRSAALRPSDYRLLAEFRHHLRAFTAFSEDAARAAGLAPQQHQALLAIKGAASAEDATVGFLAEELLLQPHSAAELAERMVKSGVRCIGLPSAKTWAR